MDKHWIGFIIIFFIIAIRQLLNPTNDSQLRVFFKTVFQSYQDNGRVLMKGWVEWNPI